MEHRTSFIKFLSSVLILSLASGCYSYTARLRVAPDHPGAGRLSDTQITRVVETVSRVSRSVGLARIQRLSIESDVGDFAVWAKFGRDHDLNGRRSRILVLVGQDKADGGAVVLIRDWDSTSETEFTESLKSAIEAALAGEFTPGQVTVERLYDMPSFYVP